MSKMQFTKMNVIRELPHLTFCLLQWNKASEFTVTILTDKLKAILTDWTEKKWNQQQNAIFVIKIRFQFICSWKTEMKLVLVIIFQEVSTETKRHRKFIFISNW